ncbi:YesL family protein [Pseudobutyrivibrio xylanivorans]|uniref:DUF624 domain-containing protein n=1 Tax=Pseudobutyrivibrio xylanivorans TaxID=185007 RepID=A0A5P6VTA5_PSEXY|nr:YesL family protein [Pseudobutyrivibrio xylanivorans]QFJ54979.1 DUF624 domain-containing protein [Pseudobutyrivibrio xylanivorans]
MGRFFNSRFFEGITKVTDILIIGFYFMICSIPLVTIGASATALYYATNKCIFKGRGYTTAFFHSFKENFKQSTLSWLIFIIIFGILSGDIYITRTMVSPDSPFAAASIFFMVLFVLTIVWAIYHFAYIARFSNGFKASFKISAMFMILNFGWSIVLLGEVVVLLLLIYRFPIFLLFSPGMISCAIHPVLERVFRKYMSPEDIKKDQEQY